VFTVGTLQTSGRCLTDGKRRIACRAGEDSQRGRPCGVPGRAFGKRPPELGEKESLTSCTSAAGSALSSVQCDRRCDQRHLGDCGGSAAVVCYELWPERDWIEAAGPFLLQQRSRGVGVPQRSRTCLSQIPHSRRVCLSSCAWHAAGIHRCTGDPHDELAAGRTWGNSKPDSILPLWSAAGVGDKSAELRRMRFPAPVESDVPDLSTPCILVSRGDLLPALGSNAEYLHRAVAVNAPNCRVALIQCHVAPLRNLRRPASRLR